MENNNNKESSRTKVVSLIEFRQKKAFAQDHAPERTPLYMSHKEGKITGSPHLRGSHVQNQDLGDKVRKIRASLDRINHLMSELKKIAHTENEIGSKSLS